MHSRNSEIYDGVPGFLGKLLTMIEDRNTDHLIKWSDDGHSFVILDQMEFAKSLLSKYYKHNNMASFTRQLNMYGFHKVITSSCNEPDIVEFYHPFFVKGKPHLLKNIKRRINIPPSSSSRENYPIQRRPMNIGSLEKLINEIRDIKGKQQNLDSQLNTVKQENEILWRELSILRHKHANQQHIVNKLIRFLMVLAPQSSSGCEKRKYMPLMLQDSRGQSSEREYLKECGLSDHQYGKYSTSPGPIIHEIHPNDLLDNTDIIGTNIMDPCTSPANSEVETELLTSPRTMLSSPEMIGSPESVQSSSIGGGAQAKNNATTTKRRHQQNRQQQFTVADQLSPPPNGSVRSTPTPTSSQSVGGEHFLESDDHRHRDGFLIDLVEKSSADPDPNTEYITIYLHPTDVGSDETTLTESSDNEDDKLASRATTENQTTMNGGVRKIGGGGGGGAGRVASGKGSYRISRTESGSIAAERLKPRSAPRVSCVPKLTRITTSSPLVLDTEPTTSIIGDGQEELDLPEGAEYILDVDENGVVISVHPKQNQSGVGVENQNRKRKLDEKFTTTSFKSPIRLNVNNSETDRGENATAATTTQVNHRVSLRTSSLLGSQVLINPSKDVLESISSKRTQQPTASIDQQLASGTSHLTINHNNNNNVDSAAKQTAAADSSGSFEKISDSKTDHREVLLNLVESADDDSLLNYLNKSRLNSPAVANEINDLLLSAAVNNTTDSSSSSRGSSSPSIGITTINKNDKNLISSDGKRKKSNLTSCNNSTMLAGEKIKIDDLLQSSSKEIENILQQYPTRTNNIIRNRDVTMSTEDGISLANDVIDTNDDVNEFFQVNAAKNNHNRNNGVGNDLFSASTVVVTDNETCEFPPNVASAQQQPSLPSSWHVGATSTTTTLESSEDVCDNNTKNSADHSNLSVACPDDNRFGGASNPPSLGPKYNMEDISCHLESVQADLDNLRSLIKKQGLSIDYNTLLDIFNDDSSAYGFPAENNHSPTNKTKPVEGNEIISCNSPFNLGGGATNSSNELMDFPDWTTSWNSPNPSVQSDTSWYGAAGSSTVNDIDTILNTPQPPMQYVNSPFSSEKRIRMS